MQDAMKLKRVERSDKKAIKIKPINKPCTGLSSRAGLILVHI
jgi:hypothetical protein